MKLGHVAIGRVALVLALAGCADTTPTASPSAAPRATSAPTAAPSPTVSPSATAATVRCENPVDGYALEHPADWSVAGGEGIEPCTFFDDQPLALEPGTEATGVAIRTELREVPLEQARRDAGGEQEERTVGGRAAVRAAGTTTDDVLLPAGTPFTTWLLDLDGRTLVLVTNEAGESVEVLDAMALTVEAL